MAVIKVSGQSQLTTALASAKSGDTLALAAGNYGKLELKVSGITLTSQSDSNPAVFSKISGKKLSGVTIDSVKFEGIGGANAGTGLQIANSSDISVIDSEFTGYKIGSFVYTSSDITFKGNYYTRMYHDAMNFADLVGVSITNNTYSQSGSQPGYTHKDFIQFWTNATYNQVASKDITITGNKFYSNGDNASHGIFMNNEWDAQKYQNVTISNNYIEASQTHGLTVDNANNLKITGNTIVKDGSGVPVINVTPDSTNVTITNNTAPGIPNQGNSSWVVSGNVETVSNAWQWTDGKSGSPVTNGGTTVSGSGLGYGDADAFRFYGTKVTKDRTDKVSDMSFSEGDTLVLADYKAGTFKSLSSDSNVVWHNKEGDYVKIDSIADIKELDKYSSMISTHKSGGDVIMDIVQGSHTQHLVLEDYASLF